MSWGRSSKSRNKLVQRNPGNNSVRGKYFFLKSPVAASPREGGGGVQSVFEVQTTVLKKIGPIKMSYPGVYQGGR